MNQSFDLSSLLTELIYGTGPAEPVEQIVDRLLAPRFALRNNGQVYDRSGFIAHVGELRQMAVGGGEMRVLEEISTDAGIAGRYLFRMLSAEGQSLSVEAHVFAKVNDGKVERIVEVARQVENTEEDFLADTSFSPTPQEINVPIVLSVPSPLDHAFVSLLCDSYERLLGKRLTAGAPVGQDVAHWLYHEAPFAVLAQDASDDPAFVYANTAAQTRFAYSWEEFCGMPSRLSAPSADREARQSLLAGVMRDGHVQGYRGLRVSGSGQLFWIEDVTIWNLAGEDGVVRGQAAVIPSWSDA